MLSGTFDLGSYQLNVTPTLYESVINFLKSGSS
jgi:hypothetical protein